MCLSISTIWLVVSILADFALKNQIKRLIASRFRTLINALWGKKFQSVLDNDLLVARLHFRVQLNKKIIYLYFNSFYQTQLFQVRYVIDFNN